ncbi:MAG TPA: BatA domain-containing protein, partial [Vicinamibacterales bacterium]|nr:BatA domain-containing protein [Vicinamibacterales bacterium]
MSIAWLNTAALWGLALIALPIAIHLLVRHHTRSVHYPSLRFVRETALAAFRRRAIQDALLLACRAAIIAAAALALAGPIVQTPGRAERFAERLSRAVVRIDDADVDPQLLSDAFRTRTFQRPHIADAINDAVRWLESQPPSLREIAFAGAFTKGQVASSDLHRVPAGIGIRFVPVTASPPANTFTQTILTRRDGRLVF